MFLLLRKKLIFLQSPCFKSPFFSRYFSIFCPSPLLHPIHILKFSFRSMMNLTSVVEVIETVLPKTLAEKWDNTGLLIEPQPLLPISTIFFTNDLTEPVLEEALAAKANLILSYHPPIFSSFKALTTRKWKDRIVMRCIQNSIALYSPHTACDAVQGGVNDWLLTEFDVKDVKPIIPSQGSASCIIEFYSCTNIDLKEMFGPNFDFHVLQKGSYEDKSSFKIIVKSELSSRVSQVLSACPSVLTVSVQECKKLDCLSLTGMGRTGKLENPIKLSDCIKKVKHGLKLENIRVAFGIKSTLDSPISTIAVCAGSGASLLRDVPADLYITGEMSHHELLDANHKNANVILCEHSNSERGYLHHLIKTLEPKLKGVDLVVSKVDKDPICIL